ncbi:MAG TPA: MFS transporter, partial [Phenylobacterium sp.]
MRRIASYQTGLALLCGGIGGLVGLDRAAIGFLGPFIVADLHLSNAQLGLAASAVSLTWGLASYLVARLADGAGRTKAWLLAAVVAFSMVSAATGLAVGFVTLVVARLVLGAAEGPVIVLTLASTIRASDDDRRGLNLGVNGFMTFLIGGALAPVLLVALATAVGWRGAFFLTGVPGLFAALAGALWLRPDPPRTSAAPSPPSGPPLGLSDLLRTRNLPLCLAAAPLLSASGGIAGVFIPLYLVNVRHLSPAVMGQLMGVLGAALTLSMFAAPALSDRFGRKPIAVLASLIALIPLGCLLWTGPIIGLAAFFAAGGLAIGSATVLMNSIPSDSVEPRIQASAIGLVSGAAEIFGGFGAPVLAGLAADRWGLSAPLIMLIVCAGLAGALALG